MPCDVARRAHCVLNNFDPNFMRDGMMGKPFAAAMLMMPLALSACKMGDPSASAMSLKGKLAPDFTLKDTEDQDITLSAYRGRPIILAFWAYG